MEEFIENFQKFKEFVKFADENRDEPVITTDFIVRFKEWGLMDAF